MIEIDNFSQDNYRELSGGMVNVTGVIRVDNSKAVVYQRSQEIGQEYFTEVYRDRNFCESIGIRQIQIDPAKFLRAKTISEHLTKNGIRHSRLLEAQDYSRYGSAVMNCIEGVSGSAMLEANSGHVWDRVGSFVAAVNQVPYESLAGKLGFNLNQLAQDNWMANRFTGLLARLKLNGVQNFEDISIAKEAYSKLFSEIPTVESPICLTYDDAKPDSLIFPHDVEEEPYIVDMESFTIGHRIIDGIGRALYWGPIREPIKSGQQQNLNDKDKVAEAYNGRVPASWRISNDQIDLWCVASELFWLPDVIATHTVAPFLPAAKLHGTDAKLQRFSALVRALYNDDIEQAKEITFS